MIWAVMIPLFLLSIVIGVVPLVVTARREERLGTKRTALDLRSSPRSPADDKQHLAA